MGILAAASRGWHWFLLVFRLVGCGLDWHGIIGFVIIIHAFETMFGFLWCGDERCCVVGLLCSSVDVGHLRL